MVVWENFGSLLSSNSLEKHLST